MFTQQCLDSRIISIWPKKDLYRHTIRLIVYGASLTFDEVVYGLIRLILSFTKHFSFPSSLLSVCLCLCVSVCVGSCSALRGHWGRACWRGHGQPRSQPGGAGDCGEENPGQPVQMLRENTPRSAVQQIGWVMRPSRALCAVFVAMFPPLCGCLTLRTCHRAALPSCLGWMAVLGRHAGRDLRGSELPQLFCWLRPHRWAVKSCFRQSGLSKRPEETKNMARVVGEFVFIT